MAVSLNDKGLTVGGTVTNIVTTLGSTIFGYGFVYQCIKTKGGESYTMTDPGVGGAVSAGRRYYQAGVTVYLPSNGTYLAISYTTYSSGDIDAHGLELNPVSGTVYSGGASFNCPSKSGNYSYVYVLALRLT